MQLFLNALWRSLAYCLHPRGVGLSVLPLIKVLPPLVWGRLTDRVFAFDDLAVHATVKERHALMWASGAMFVAMAPAPALAPTDTPDRTNGAHDVIDVPSRALRTHE
jgi:hypothetical protein